MNETKTLKARKKKGNTLQMKCFSCKRSFKHKESKGFDNGKNKTAINNK